MIETTLPKYLVVRDEDACTHCHICERECANGVHVFDKKKGVVRAKHKLCVNCLRCVMYCPTDALHIEGYPQKPPANANWSGEYLRDTILQADTGSVLLGSMGAPTPQKIYWDHLLLNASQVTNPSIDPLREPMETRVILGAKPERLSINEKTRKLLEPLPPQISLDMPIMFAAMSFGAVSLNTQRALAIAAHELGTYFNTGEGGLHSDLEKYGADTIVQVASGRFGVDMDYLETGAMIEIKIGQGAKPGIGGHLPGEKVNAEISVTRMIPEGSDSISPAPHHDIYSIEDLRQLIHSLKEATRHEKPVCVKIAAVHNAPAIASGIVRAGADMIAIDGYRGGTGAAPKRIRDNVGIPIELALASIDSRLREEGIRNNVSLIASGSIRSSADVVKAIALGADAVYMGSAALIALGCHMCASCSTGKCNWGIATQKPELTKRLDPEEGAARVVNLVNAWNLEIQEMLGGMGINAIESLRGNRLMLRGVDLSDRELSILGIKHAGE